MWWTRWGVPCAADAGDEPLPVGLDRRLKDAAHGADSFISPESDAATVAVARARNQNLTG